MSTNNIPNNPLLRNILNPQQIQNHPQQSINTSIVDAQPVLGEVNAVPSAEHYRQFLATNPLLANLNMTAEQVNNSEADLRQIYEIDKQVFADTDPYDSYDEFKNIIRRYNLSTYAIKNSSGQIIGYYQLEPIKDGDLYIDSIGMKPEFQRTRQGYQAIKYAWGQILDYAMANNVQSLSLHVNANDLPTLNLYKNFGFAVEETLNNYYGNGVNALFMTRPIEQTDAPQVVEPVTTQEIEETTPTETIQEAEQVAKNTQTQEIEQDIEPDVILSPKQIAENQYREKAKQVFERFHSNGEMKYSKINRYITACSYEDKNGNLVLDDKLMACYDKLEEIQERIKSEDCLSDMKVCNIVCNIVEKNAQGQVTKVRDDLVSYIECLADKGVEGCRYNDIISAATITNQDGSTTINTAALEYAVNIAKKVKDCHINDNIRSCIDKSGRFNQKIAEFISRNLEIDSWELSKILNVCTTEDENGNRVFNDDLYFKIKNEINKNGYSKIYSFHNAEEIAKTGCSIDDYLKYYDRTFTPEKKFVLTDEYVPDKENIAGLIKAAKAQRRYFDYSSNKYDLENYMNFYSVINTYKKYESKFVTDESIKKEQVYGLLNLIDACKTTDERGNTNINEELLDKAVELKNLGCLLIDKENTNRYSNSKGTIADLINACKTTKTNFFGYEEIGFDNEAFGKIKLAISEGITPEKVLATANLSKEIRKDYSDKKYSTFNQEAFKLLLSINIDTYKLSNAFQEKKEDGTKCIDMRSLRAYNTLEPKPDIELLADEPHTNARGNYQRKMNSEAILAYKYFYKNIPTCSETCEVDGKTRHYENNQEKGDYEIVRKFINLCKTRDKDEYYSYERFNYNIFREVQSLLEQGYDGNAVHNFIGNCKNTYSENPERLKIAKQLHKQGVDLISAGKIAAGCVDSNGKLDAHKLNKTVELYNLGLDGNQATSAVASCYTISRNKLGLSEEKTENFDELAYQRTKEVVEKGLPLGFASVCKSKENGWNDRVYRLALELHERGYGNNAPKLISLCFDSITDETMPNGLRSEFNEKTYERIAELEELGIPKDEIIDVIKTCKHNRNSMVDVAYEKVSELIHMGYDLTGVHKIIEKSISGYNEFMPEKYEKILDLCARHKALQNAAYSTDAKVIEELLINETAINNTRETFGTDVLNYMVSAKVPGYVNFAKECNNIIGKTDEDFIKNLQEKLELLPNPELKAKRLKMIGALAGKIDNSSLKVLVDMIKSPKMTEEQILLADEIFSDETKTYDEQIEEFITKFHVPEKTASYVRNYLQKEQLNNQIDRPKSIDEQKVQMDEFAQKMLCNPKIPLDKKLKYINEFNAKKDDMDANPEKYTRPRMYAKPMTNLAKVVEAYINIPNADIMFNNSVTERMYDKYGITATPEMMKAIKYDAKYFSGLLSPGSGFDENFKRLIKFKELNNFAPLTQIRNLLPEEGSELWNKYQELGLIDQIKANLDTKRQFEENNLDFNKWNTFDPNLKGEEFNVEIDPEVEYNNIKSNMVNVFKDDLFEKISTEETDKLMDKLSQNGFTIFDNKIFKNGQTLTNPDIERFLDIVITHTENENYWKSAKGEGNLELTSEEKEGATGFMDHIKGFKKRYEDVKNSKNVQGIRVRLTDDNDIGRNIFFGDHVGCCNSVTSSYAAYSAPQHLLNNYNRGIELVDRWGNSYGNSLCFFANINGELAFVIDSFEANGKLGSNPVVTEELIKFAKQICAEMGRPDAKVVIGPNYNNMYMGNLTKTEGNTIEVIGTVSHRTYCDSVGGRVLQEINQPVANRNLYICN